MNCLDMVVNFLISLFASVVGILFVLWLDRQKRPKLSMTVEVGKPGGLEEDNPYKRPPSTWLHVHVQNQSLDGLASLFYDREPAFGCRAWITFYRYHDHSCVFEHEMDARWSDTAVPEIPAFYKNIKVLPKGLQEAIDIQPGDPVENSPRLDIAMRIKGDDECYGWNNAGYLYDDYRNPNWRLEKGRYIARVRIKTGGREFRDLFMVCNDGDYNSFKLEPVGKKEKENLMKSLPKCSAA